MKLNAAAEIMPISWPELAGLHPFVPRAQAAGTHAMLEDVGRALEALHRRPAHDWTLESLAREAGVTKLSMGMSGDYELAIAFGATGVRVGSAIFGSR